MLLLHSLRPAAGQQLGGVAAAGCQQICCAAAAALRGPLAACEQAACSSSASSASPSTNNGSQDKVQSWLGGLHVQRSAAPAAAASAATLWPAQQRHLMHLHYHQHHHHQQHQQQQQHHQHQQTRGYRGAAKRVRHPLPPPLAAAAVPRPRAPPPPLEPRPLQFGSRRAGAIAVKAGMTQEWDEFGARVPLTVLWIDECVVVRHKTTEADGTTALVLGAGSKKEKQLHPRQVGEFKALNLPPARKLWECPVTPDALLPAGTPIGAAHFVAGQYLDVTGTSKGKGFAGVMKRWNFAGQPASHGNTKSHRRGGSIGGRTDPGRVWKGKKMPGRLGGETVTVKNIWVYKVDPARNLVYVRGQVPGPTGSFLLLRDAFRWHWAGRAAAALPFPTALPPPAPGAPPPAVTKAGRDGPDPYLRYRADVGEMLEGATWKTE